MISVSRRKPLSVPHGSPPPSPAGTLTLAQPFSAVTCSMTGEHNLSLRQINQARGDLYAIADELETVKIMLARLPRRPMSAAPRGWRRRAYGRSRRGRAAVDAVKKRLHC
jgi:hypothetical protein